ncbi:unnamed protein product [Penicillium roqueforti FM164]|uniref:Uncharacterized protein n=1 Tax=Penicillium roqueforti (strain FM164) TaxID=1365484 RepID=W6QUZ7_PENRF|nr:unnamed protein product [Penicillium roqueforti FM164]
MEYADQFVKLSETLDATIMEWFAIFECTAMFETYSADDKSVWLPIRTAVDRARETEKHKRFEWSAVARLQQIGYGTTFAKQCAFLAARVVDWPQFCHWVNWVAFLRCTNGKQGQKRRPGVITGDITSAHDRLNELSMLDMPTDDIVPAMLRPEQGEEIGCVIDPHGLLIPRPVETRLIVPAAPVDPLPPPSPSASHPEAPPCPVASSCPASVGARNKSRATPEPSVMQQGTFSSLAGLDEQDGARQPGARQPGARRPGARISTLWVSFHRPWPPVLRGPPQITPGRICQLLGVDPDLEFPSRQKPTTIPQLLFGSFQHVSTSSDRRPVVLAMAQQEVNIYPSRRRTEGYPMGEGVQGSTKFTYGDMRVFGGCGACTARRANPHRLAARRDRSAWPLPIETSSRHHSTFHRFEPTMSTDNMIYYLMTSSSTPANFPDSFQRNEVE